MASGKDGQGFDPMHQFEVATIGQFNLFGLDLSFTNSSLWMVISVVGVIGLMLAATIRSAMIPGRMQSVAELSVTFIRDLMNDTIGPAGRPFFPFVFSLFMFILFGNMLGMIPYSFTFTSHIIVTLALAMVVFILMTVLGFIKHGMHFFTFFVPPGVPKAMWVLLIPIEIISYLSRPIALSVRLFANMLAGHTLIKVIASFVPQMLGAGVALGILSVMPFALITALTGLEILIAFLQAYVFAILTCLYINDALHLH